MELIKHIMSQLPIGSALIIKDASFGTYEGISIELRDKNGYNISAGMRKDEISDQGFAEKVTDLILIRNRKAPL